MNRNIRKCFNHQDLKENESIQLTMSFKNSSLWYIFETKENAVENNVGLDIPISLTQYIEVRKIFIGNVHVESFQNQKHLY